MMLLTDRHQFAQRIRVDHSGCYAAQYKDYTLKSVFQPIFNRSNAVIGMEALVRLFDKNSQPVPPALFFQNKQVSLVDQLNVDRLSRAIHLRNFSMSRYRDRLIFLNFLPISSERLAAEGLKSSLLMSRLKALQIDARRVVVELVELTAFSSQTLSCAARHLNEEGFLIAIDDFGCKESNPERVAKVKPNIIKLDRQLLQDYMQGSQSALLDGIALAQQWGAKTVVEGIETQQQLEAMHALEVDFFQGYHLAMPQELPPCLKQVI
ncbi:EAL domain, c-di-GMP-specific phosphodiesterase class I (or its enzymatically inactive variant) [Vibrio hangzhouensis]|uniref:EAL domain, c-di-GMP-specific phosphodiesterase class I (Or its enzymatically inactive variant) n=2 Tax=Vibrio hangzhouensis TaxID=462991 RepID=A0A1H5WUV2_9VIBR|nr:EAL domain-containing protein [Vibrio hangzhouensis]SEG02727.1 EAL domain, c-di-GMP-specific phosphodiesterase class I (or its enzymatically inactive variant) [Vibrio hangzhouensis]